MPIFLEYRRAFHYIAGTSSIFGHDSAGMTGQNKEALKKDRAEKRAAALRENLVKRKARQKGMEQKDTGKDSEKK